jgi:hypothetical protein
MPCCAKAGQAVRAGSQSVHETRFTRMTIRITGPRRRAPQRGAIVALIVAAIIVLICLILLGLTADFLVDWLWFSAIGYLGVFWTTIVAEAGVFVAVFVATAVILWLNGLLAFRFARLQWTQHSADFESRRTRFPRRACRLGRGPQLGRFPADPRIQRGAPTSRALVLRQNTNADLPCCNADDEGEDDRSLTASDTKTRSLNQASSVRSSCG